MHRFRTARRPSGVSFAFSFALGLGIFATSNAHAEDDAFDRAAKDGSGVRLTADAVGKRAAATSFSARAQEEGLRAAAAKVDQTWSTFLPRFNLTARYTRLSPLTNPPFGLSGGSGGNLVGTNAPAGTFNPPTVAVAIPDFSIPVILDNYLLQAQIVVPISDYFLRINQAYSATTHARDAAKYDILAARAKSFSEGQLAFYTHIRARGTLIVAEQTVGDVKAHAADAKSQFTAGNASKADVLRAETAVAAAELQVERVKNLVALTQRQLRLALHAKDEERFSLGEDLEAPLPPMTETLPNIVSEALQNRPEMKSMELNMEALKAQARGNRGSALPQVSGFGDVTFANPNQRKFPISDEWFPTWSLGLQATWSPNDILGGLAQGREVDAKVAQIEAQRAVIREGIEVEATQAWQAIRESEVAIASSKRQKETSEEALRVARELFRNGRGTATLVSDAETDVTRSRLELINANIEARTARIRLAHATGRDVKHLPAGNAE